MALWADIFIFELQFAETQAALQQIKDKNYVQSVADYTGNILLVGISYDKKSKEHACIIEEYNTSLKKSKDTQD